MSNPFFSKLWSDPNQTCLSRRDFMKVAALSSFAIAIVAGCGPKLGQYQVKSLTPPPIKNCFDTIGHRGFKPFVLGGTCYCNPTPAQLAIWQKEGSFVDKSLDEVMNDYKARNVKTIYDHQECNNMCKWGPHVVKGGGCMVPPTPMTDNYEEVATGEWKSAPKSAQTDDEGKNVKASA